jgi:hypothetical protein
VSLFVHFISPPFILALSSSPAQNSTSRPTGRRSQSQDSGGIVEKPRSNGKPRSKKGSQHADVIDRLDFTGVGPSTSSLLVKLRRLNLWNCLVFHHDGPFDACAPSRNKHRNKAPLHAWTGKPDHAPIGDSAYSSALAYQAFSNDYPDPPKKKVDAIAEAWGIHEPEPFEEFFAGGGSTRPDGDTPASSIYNGKESHGSLSTSHSSPATRRPKEDKDARPRVAARRSLVPPPQPIFVPDQSDADVPPSSPPLGSPGFPNRSKSLMHRIRKMRDAPNVPVSADYEQPPSPSTQAVNYQSDSNGTRPTHRSQNSFLGRFGGGTRINPASVPEKPEPFIFIDAQNQNQTNKELPATPMNGGMTPPGEESPPGVHFDGSQGGPLGRKASLMKKVGRVVRGAK